MRILLLTLVACDIETDLHGKPAEPWFDEGDTDPARPDTDTRVDTGDTGEPVEPLECPALTLGEAGAVAVTEECAGTSGTEVDDPWNFVLEWEYTTVTSGQGVLMMPAVGQLTDDDGDGDIDADDMPDIAFTTWTADTLVAVSGADGRLLFEVPDFSGTGGVTIADIDGDGAPDIVGFDADWKPRAVDASGAPMWAHGVAVTTAFPQPTVADLDGDGTVEVIADVAVLNGEDGSLVATLPDPGVSYRTSVAADIDQDGTQEIVLGHRVYDHTGAVEWSAAGTGTGAFSAIADVDGDVEGEVFFVSGTMGFLYEADGTLITSFRIPGSVVAGPPCAADFDGDGAVELAVPNGNLLTVFEADGSVLWSATGSDSSGLAGCSAWDVNADGAYEVLYADEAAFRMYSGIDGTVLTAGSHTSVTIWEYPVIADVDGDGAGEIIVVENFGWTEGIRVYGHDGGAWPAAGSAWPTHDYALTNIDPDGHVPTDPEPSWQTHNVFRGRPATDAPTAQADLVVTVTDVCVMDCVAGPVKLAIQVANHGAADVPAGALVSVWAHDDTPRLVGTVTLPAVPAGTALDGIEVALTPADVSANGFSVTVDDDGAGVGTVRECDESNNTDRYTDVFCP